MSRFTGTALALLLAFSIDPMAQVAAGDRNDGPRVVKHSKLKFADRKGNRHHRSTVRIVNRNVVVVKADGKFRHAYRGYRQVNTYSGDVVIDVRNGVGQWSYGSFSADAVPAAAVPNAKIIDVDAITPNNGCDMQAGVCVIRP
jgi:hypothetical protein